MSDTFKPLKAVVFGGTGAIGRELVAQLVASPRWGKVTTIGRRPLGKEEHSSVASSEKLQQIVIDMDTIETNPEVASALSNDTQTVFCALGTTRSAAGSADAFKKVDLLYVKSAAKAAKAAGVPHFSLVSAQGASSKVWASNWALFHGLLYTKCKGLAEDAIVAEGFDRVTIVRPGLLDRGDLARSVEKLFSKLLSSIPVSKVAAFMVHDAEKSEGEAVHIASMAEMQNLIQA